MSAALNVLSYLLLASGSLLLIVGGIGLLRFPDFYSRIQAAGLTDTLCSISILLGLLLQADSLSVAAKLLFTLLFLMLTGPTAAHALAKAAHHDQLKPWSGDAGGPPSNP